jgi:hypothetical protein
MLNIAAQEAVFLSTEKACIWPMMGLFLFLVNVPQPCCRLTIIHPMFTSNGYVQRLSGKNSSRFN